MNRARQRLRWIVAIGAVLFSLCVADYWGYPYGASMPGRPEPQSRNGLWLRYTWYFGERTAQEVSKLGPRLQRDGIRYAFFHVRNISREGKLVHRKEAQARVLNDTLRAAAPGVKRIAWIYAGNRTADGLVDWNRPEIRRQMVAEAKWLVETCGFDGVQWDCEIAPRSDAGIFALLLESRAAFGTDVFIGFAAPMWLPTLGIGWDDASFASIAKVCDQIAVMAYDTGAYFPRAYASLVAAQRDRISRAISGTRCRLIIGLPTYGPGLPSHNTRAENLEIALRGVRQASEPIEGVALFADYTTDDREWATYRREWLGQ